MEYLQHLNSFGSILEHGTVECWIAGNKGQLLAP